MNDVYMKEKVGKIFSAHNNYLEKNLKKVGKNMKKHLQQIEKYAILRNSRGLQGEKREETWTLETDSSRRTKAAEAGIPPNHLFYLRRSSV